MHREREREVLVYTSIRKRGREWGGDMNTKPKVMRGYTLNTIDTKPKVMDGGLHTCTYEA